MAETIQALREQHAAVMAEADKLLSAEEFGEEQEKAAEAKLSEAEKLQKRIEIWERKDKAAAFAVRPNGEPPRAPLQPETAGEDGADGKTFAPVRGVHSQFGHSRFETKCFASDDHAEAAGMWILGTQFTGPKGEQSKQVRHAKEWLATSEAHQLLKIESLGHTASNDSIGGQFVPQIIEAAVAKLRLQYGVIRRLARNVPMTSDNALWPRPLVGSTVYPLAEVPSDITESQLSASSFQMRVVDWGTKFLYSRNLEEDAAVSIADMMVRDFAYRLAKNEDTVCFNSSGLGTSHGIWGIFNKLQDATYANSVYTTITGNTAWSTLDLDDFEAMAGKLPSFAESGAVWVISKQAFFASMARLAYAAGGNTYDTVAGGTQMQFLGYPVVFSEVFNKTLDAQTSAYGCLLGNLSLACTFGDRRGMTMETNPYKYMEQRQMLLVATQRWGFAAHDLLDEDGGCGPVVAMKFAGS